MNKYLSEVAAPRFLSAIALVILATDPQERMSQAEEVRSSLALLVSKTTRKLLIHRASAMAALSRMHDMPRTGAAHSARHPDWTLSPPEWDVHPGTALGATLRASFRSSPRSNQAVGKSSSQDGAERPAAAADAWKGRGKVHSLNAAQEQGRASSCSSADHVALYSQSIPLASCADGKQPQHAHAAKASPTRLSSSRWRRKTGAGGRASHTEEDVRAWPFQSQLSLTSLLQSLRGRMDPYHSQQMRACTERMESDVAAFWDQRGRLSSLISEDTEALLAG